MSEVALLIKMARKLDRQTKSDYFS